MNFDSPKYGRSALKKIFSNKIEIRDYSKIESCKDKYPYWGICVLAYSTSYDIAAKIHYLPSNKIWFQIEMEDKEILSSYWESKDVNDSVYEYYLFIINKIKKDKDETREHSNKFDSKSWISWNVKNL